MRFVDLTFFKPSDAWLAKAEAATETLRKMNAGERAQYLKSASAAKLWGELRGELSALNHERCWYTEAPIGAGDAQLEHFRPKLGFVQRNEQEHEGYWWLAFNYRNYRIAASVPNRTKSSAFPVLGPRAKGEWDELLDECAVLLDPTIFSDTLLLTVAESGLVVPVSGASEDERVRVEYSVLRYGLNTGAVVRARQKRWLDTLSAVQSWHTARVGSLRSPSRRSRADVYAQSIRHMARDSEPYVSTVRACIRLYADGYPVL